LKPEVSANHRVAGSKADRPSRCGNTPNRERWREIWELNDMEKGQSIKEGDCFLLPDK